MEHARTGLPVEPADKHVAGEAHASPVLQAAVPQLPSQPACLQLGHGGQLGYVLAFDVHTCT